MSSGLKNIVTGVERQPTWIAPAPAADRLTNSSRGTYSIRFPCADETHLSQSEAYFILAEDGGEVKIRFHDYAEIYIRPGLYEQLFYYRLKCQSPRLVAKWLAKACSRSNERIQALRILDVGAGNGMMGQELARYGHARLVGVDIINEARLAAERDQPGLYDRYFVGDLCENDSEMVRSLSDWKFNCMVAVAALGFGDLPAQAFSVAYNLVQDGGWIAFNVKETFLSSEDKTGFSLLVREMILNESLEIHRMIRYQHRLSIDGMPLFYNGVVGRKRHDAPLIASNGRSLD